MSLQLSCSYPASFPARASETSLLPSHLDGIPIDVVEVGAIEALDAGRARRKRMRRC